jgi:hypothetical protein
MFKHLTLVSNKNILEHLTLKFTKIQNTVKIYISVIPKNYFSITGMGL